MHIYLYVTINIYIFVSIGCICFPLLIFSTNVCSLPLLIFLQRIIDIMLYKKIDSTSVSTITSALNLFETPPTNVSIANSAYRQILTLNPITSTPFHFKIHPITSFIDLSKCYIQTEMKLRKLDGANNPINVPAGEDISTIQMIGATYIKNLKIVVNGQVICT